MTPPASNPPPEAISADGASAWSPWTPPVPMPTRVETSRYVLRTFAPEDAAALLMAVRESRSTLHPWLPWAMTDHRTLGQTHASIARFAAELTPTVFEAGRLNLVLGVFDRATGRLLGGTGMHTFRPRAHQAEIGYWLRVGERGRGHCAGAVAGLISWAFTPQGQGGWGLRRLEVICAASNAASAGVPRRLGFTEQNRTRSDMWVAGRGFEDTLRFGVLASEWEAAGGRVRDGRAG